MTKTIAILCLNHVVPFDFSIPIDVFGFVRLPNGKPAYKVVVCGPRKRVRTAHFEIKISQGLEALKKADTIIVPGVYNFDEPIDLNVLKSLHLAAKRGVRIASICTGAFVLGSAGLLDGKTATTHWMAAVEFRQKFPLVDLDPNVLYVDHGKILTSAGAAAGLDLCLHLIRKDFGSAIAAQAARLAVVPLERSGGQAQFISHAAPVSAGSLATTLAWMQKNFSEPLKIEQMANRAKMSERTFIRKFRDQTGVSPLQWLLRYRITKAKELLELTSNSVESVCEHTGFNGAISFRKHFKKQVGVSPTEYRASFRGRS